MIDPQPGQRVTWRGQILGESDVQERTGTVVRRALRPLPDGYAWVRPDGSSESVLLSPAAFGQSDAVCTHCAGLGTIWAPSAQYPWLERHNPLTSVAAEGRHYVRCPACKERR